MLWKKHVSAPIRYYSADLAVATVDAKGNVTTLTSGVANIYAVAPSGVFAVTKINVTAKEPAFIIDGGGIHTDNLASYSIDGGKTFQPCLYQEKTPIYATTVIIRCDENWGKLTVNDQEIKEGETKSFSNPDKTTQTLYIKIEN